MKLIYNEVLYDRRKIMPKRSSVHNTEVQEDEAMSTTAGDVGISSLYFCDSFLYIGLAEGQVIIMDAISSSR